MESPKRFSTAALKDSSKNFNDFFYGGDGRRPSWMQVSDSSDYGSDEEKLLDDAQDCYLNKCASIDSSRAFSRTCSLESQESELNDSEKETEVVLRVAMCCGSCENKVKSLTQMEGVTTVVCDRKREKVTVTGTARPRDVLEACKKLFVQSKIWTAEDDAFDDLHSVAAYGNSFHL